YCNLDWIPSVELLTVDNEGISSEVISLVENLENTVPFGSSTMYDAIYSSAQIMSDNDLDTTRKLIYVLTDNDTNASVYSIDKTIEEVNNIDGDKKVPIISGNLSIVEPRTLSVKANETDTSDLNKLGYFTGGQSVTLTSTEFLDDVAQIFYAEATGVLGYGTYEFVSDLGEEVQINALTLYFDVVSEQTNASWQFSYSSDGYNFILNEENYSYNIGEVSFTDLHTRYLRFDINLITGFSATLDEYSSVIPLESPSLTGVKIDYSQYKTVYLLLNKKDDLVPVTQVVVSTSVSNIEQNQVKVGLASSDAISWIDYSSDSQPLVNQNGKIVIPVRFSQGTDSFDNEPLNKIDNYMLKAHYGQWDPDSTVFVYDSKNGGTISSVLYDIVPRDGLVILSYPLEKDYTDGDYKIGILNGSDYKIGIELTNKSKDNQIEIYGFGHIYTTGKGLLPPIEKIPPEAKNILVSPVNPEIYTTIELTYDYYDVNFDEEDISRTVIKWYIDDIHIEYLDGYKIWNDVNNFADPLWHNAFTFDGTGLTEDQIIIQARENKESILSLDNNIYCSVKVSDGELFGNTIRSNNVVVLESSPVISQLEIVGVDAYGTESKIVTSETTAIAKFNYYSDTDINNSEVIWYVGGQFFKGGLFGSKNEQGILYEELKPGEYGLNTTRELALKYENTIYVQVIPQTEGKIGDTINSDTITVGNALPVVGGLALIPKKPSSLQNIILSWDFYDFEIHALFEGETNSQTNRTSVQWWKKDVGTDTDWEKIYDNADALPEVFVLKGYEGCVDVSRSRTDNISIISYVNASNENKFFTGQQWKAVVTPNDFEDDGIPVESEIVTIQNWSNEPDI
ncbi:MAG: hypothetical protein J7L15_02730, partial [Clostridiales bacterium]|nr:hypothetical protein [Clostridiales bacterium]